MECHELGLPEERVLTSLRAMKEADLTKKVIIPILKGMGASHVRYLHGSFERGKDLACVFADSYGDGQLEVCQVKNEAFSDRAGANSHTASVLAQVQQARRTEVLNPQTNCKELPQAVRLWTTYPLPDKGTADMGAFLSKLRADNCRVVTPEKLVALFRQYLPDLYEQIAFPGQGISRGLVSFLNSHHEASAFEVKAVRHLSDFFVDLGLSQRLKQRNRPDRAEDTKQPRGLIKSVYYAVSAISKTLPQELATFPFLQISASDLCDTKMSKVGVTDTHISAFAAKIGEFIERSLRTGTQEDVKDAMLALRRGSSLLQSLLGSLPDKDLSEADKELLALPPSMGASEMPPEAFLYLEDNICVTGEAGAGKTSVARMIAQAALNEGKPVVYFPCSRIHDSHAFLEDEIQAFVGSVGESTSAEVSTYLKTARLVIIDGCDEAASFGAKLGQEIRDLAFIAFRKSNVTHA